MNKIVLFGLLLFLPLISCDQNSPKKGKDEYKFETKEWEKPRLTVDVVVVPSQAEFEKLRKEVVEDNIPGYEVMAFSKLHPTIDHCTIYIIDPKVNYIPEFLGHEMAHCIWGRFHPTQP